jgi:hypothetical protein
MENMENMNYDDYDKNIDFLLRLCINEKLYTYETALIILQTLNYSQEKFKKYKQYLISVFEEIEKSEENNNNNNNNKGSIKINYI